MALIYKTLFEVKVLHEYYLTRTSIDSIFLKANPHDRLDFLAEEFKNNLGSIDDDLSFEFPDSLKEVYDSYHIKIIKSYCGCRIVAEVIKSTLASGVEVFTPKTPFPAELNFLILIGNKNGQMDVITNSKFRQSINAKYFFSNRNISGAKVFPFLTNPVAANDSVYNYDQGELADFGGVVKKNLNDSIPNHFKTVSGPGLVNQFANENDRVLIPLKFFYSFIGQSGLTNASFELKDNGGVTIKSFSSQISSAQKTQLNFSDQPTLDQLNLVSENKNGDVYSLMVSGNNGFSAALTVMFSEQLQNSDWGLIQINQNVTNGLYNFFDADGFLKRRNNPRLEAPVFEIPVTSRLAYYKYQNLIGKTLSAPVAPLTDYLIADAIDPKILITRSPQTIAKFNLNLANPLNASTTYLPNPDQYNLNIDNQKRLFYEINVPQSELFPTV